jgi:hypothetical protein
MKLLALLCYLFALAAGVREVSLHRFRIPFVFALRYSIVPGSVDLKPGQLVQLKGKKSNDGAGAESFQAKKLVKDLGACSVDSALNTAHQ